MTLHTCCSPPSEEFQGLDQISLMTLIFTQDPPFRMRLALGRPLGMLTKLIQQQTSIRPLLCSGQSGSMITLGPALQDPASNMGRQTCAQTVMT